MTRLVVLALLCLAVTASAAIGTASASPSSASCSYKMTGYPVYIKIVGAGAACDSFGEGAKGSAVRIYTNVVGPTRCLLEERITGATVAIHSTNTAFGSLACTVMGKVKGFTRLS